MDFTLEKTQIQRIQDWLDGKTAAPREELLAFFRLSEAVKRKLLNDAITQEAKASRAQAKLDRIKDKQDGKILAGEFDCLGLDTITLAWAVLWSAFKQGLQVKNKTTFRLLVYAVYCTWLGSTRQRATVEKPAAQPVYGPVLLSMLNERKVSFTAKPTPKEYTEIQTLSPGLAKTIDNTVRKYLSLPLGDVKEYFMGEGSPYQKMEKECELQHKALPIPDSDIYLWKQSHA